MILTWTCDLCGYANDNNNGPCRHCGGLTEEKMQKGKWRTVIVKAPTIELKGYYNPNVKQS